MASPDWSKIVVIQLFVALLSIIGYGGLIMLMRAFKCRIQFRSFIQCLGLQNAATLTLLLILSVFPGIPRAEQIGDGLLALVIGLSPLLTWKERT